MGNTPETRGPIPQTPNPNHPGGGCNVDARHDADGPTGTCHHSYDRTWDAHIVKGHPEVREHRTLVEQAVESPDEIRVSRSDPDCRLFYGPGPRSSVRIIVVVDVAVGTVKTAHLAKMTGGGVLEWSK